MMHHKEEKKPFNFEQSMQEIETIVNAIEQGKISLDESIKQYERGSQLIRLCQEFLEQKNKQLEEISAQAEAGVRATKREDTD